MLLVLIGELIFFNLNADPHKLQTDSFTPSLHCSHFKAPIHKTAKTCNNQTSFSSQFRITVVNLPFPCQRTLSETNFFSSTPVEMASLTVDTFLSSHSEGINIRDWSNLDCTCLVFHHQCNKQSAIYIDMSFKTSKSHLSDRNLCQNF